MLLRKTLIKKKKKWESHSNVDKFKSVFIQNTYRINLTIVTFEIESI